MATLTLADLLVGNCRREHFQWYPYNKICAL